MPGDTALPFPLVNGHVFDFSSIELVAASQRYQGFNAVEYEQSLEAGKVHGGSTAQKIGRTRGLYDPTAKLTLYLAQWAQLRAILASGLVPANAPGAVLGALPGASAITGAIAPFIGGAAALVPGGKRGFMEVSFELVVSFAEAGQLHTDQITGCRIMKVSKAFKVGSEPLQVTLDLDVIAILENGLPPISQMAV
jgi:hypothetical protein